MSEDGKDVLGILAGVAFFLCVTSLVLKPSPMRQCVVLGYEWIGGDCVKGTTRDDQQ